jgi:acetyl-CoA synthetase
MGKPSPGYDIDIIGEDGRSCEVGEVGEIVVRTAERRPVGLFDGYHRDPERTASVWHDGVYHTGDTAWRDESGYYWFVGRTDDLIKSSGYRIGPFEVESALLEHPAVLECAVTGVPDEMRGAVVKATVVPAPGFEPGEALTLELQEHVKRVTAPYKYPRIVEFVPVLPKTISGKIRRVEIREKDQGGD